MSEKMSPEDRQKLIQQLQDDIESFVAEKSMEARNKPEKEDTRSVDEIAEELLNHPAFMKEVDWSKPLSDDMEGLMALKYESENPEARAESYREEGNDLFKKKDYRVAIENYTEAIKSKSPVRSQNAILYTNRAAAQYRLGNYRSAFNDCVIARKFKPDHLKAIVKGALCCDQMKKHADTVRWCDAGLMIESGHKELSDLKTKAQNAKSAQDYEERKQAFMERKARKATLKLLSAIQSRHIQLKDVPPTGEVSPLHPCVEAHMNPTQPGVQPVQLDEQGVLQWSVVFLYPEHSQSDLIKDYSENTTFVDMLTVMFGPDCQQTAPWDTERKYTVDRIQLYFAGTDEVFHEVSKHSTLLDALQHEKFLVVQGAPKFIVLSKGSQYQRDYLKNF